MQHKPNISYPRPSSCQEATLIGYQLADRGILVPGELSTTAIKLAIKKDPSECLLLCIAEDCFLKREVAGEPITIGRSRAIQRGFRKGTDLNELNANKVKLVENLPPKQVFTESKCDFNADNNLFGEIIRQVAEEVDPKILIQIGIGNEPAPGGDSIAETIDPDFAKELVA